jgi:hypothetical protein
MLKKMTMMWSALAVFVVGVAPAQGQTDHADHQIRAAVEQIFEGMRTANPDLVRAVFAEGARFAGVDASGAVTVQSVNGWLEAIGTSERRWDERVYDVEVHLDGNMASVWAPYTFYFDGAVRHCGINSIELLYDGSGWKVTQIADTRRTDACPDPLRRGR